MQTATMCNIHNYIVYIPPSTMAYLGSVGLHKLSEHLLHAALRVDTGEFVQHQLRGLWGDQVTEDPLDYVKCLCLKYRARKLGWELMDEGRGAGEAKQFCGQTGRVPEWEMK